MATIEHNPDNLPSTKISNWNPILDGDNYCSPACGCGCKLADYKAAVEAADLLVKTLGEGWMPIVWENLGWHYEAMKGDVTVCRERGGYTASIDIVIFVGEKEKVFLCATNSEARLAVDSLVTRLSKMITRLSMAKASATLELVELND
jgi:hypothetical protein